MTEFTKRFFAKLLLIGEYTVTLGSGALAVPYTDLGGTWTFGSDGLDSKASLYRLHSFLTRQSDLVSVLDLDRFVSDIDLGFYFGSDIPQGYGLGSSGALVAAVYDRYHMLEHGDIDTLKRILGRIECGFHGTSSGIDPLVSYLNQGIRIDEEGKTHNAIDIQIPEGMFVIDTRIPRSTEPLVRQFKEKYTQETVFRNAINDLKSLNANAISGLIKGNNIWSELTEISDLQLAHLAMLIPYEYIKMWHDGLKSDYFRLKLCGAGGGGMILGMTHKRDKLLGEYPDVEITFIG